MESIVTYESTYRADLLRAEKGRLNWTDKDIAEAAGLSVPTVRAILRGDTRVIFENVVKVAQALGLTMKQLCEAREQSEAAVVG